MALKQINWGFQFKRNSRGPLDPDLVFETYDDFTKSPSIYNGAIVCVTDDESSNRNGVYWVKENQNVDGQYQFTKLTQTQNQGLPFFICDSTEVLSVEDNHEDNTKKVKLTYNPFHAFDIIGWNISDDLTEGVYSVIQYVLGDYIYISSSNNAPHSGDIIYHLGNTIDQSRQSFYAYYLEDGHPVQCVFINSSTNSINKNQYIYVKNDESGKPIIHSENSYMIGTFIDVYGNNISDEIRNARSEIQSGLQELRDEFNINNIVYNPFFMSTLDGWTTSNEAQYYFAKNNLWIYTTNNTTQNGLYSAKRKGAYRGVYDDKTVASIQQGFILQDNESLKLSNIDKTDSVQYFSVVLMYHAVTPGTLVIQLGSQSKTYEIQKTETDWLQIKTDFLWDYTGDLKIQYTRELTESDQIYAELKVKSIQVVLNDIETLKYKYNQLLSHADTLVQLALEKENSL